MLKHIQRTPRGDRSVRPLFPASFKNDTQIIANVFSHDGINDSPALAINAASAALYLSSINWNGPVGAVSVALVDGKFVTYPTISEIQNSSLYVIVVASSPNNIIMIEANGQEIELKKLLSAIKCATNHSNSVINDIKKLSTKFSKSPAPTQPSSISHPSKFQEVFEKLFSESYKVFFESAHACKNVRSEMLKSMYNELWHRLKTEYCDCEFSEEDFKLCFEEMQNKYLRLMTVSSKKRIDGRGYQDIRDISMKMSVFPSIHGSSLFTRGETQVLCRLVFASLDYQLDSLQNMTNSKNAFEKFSLTYEFPPFANNEVSTKLGRNRREIGHGALAQKAILPVLPEDHPFYIKLSAEVLSSSGSSSMATICASTLALKDACVDCCSLVSGIAMGMIAQPDNEHILLTDISGLEDHFGDMDFKVSSTKKGFNALQLDVKLSDGISLSFLEKSLKAAYEANLQIIDKMHSLISKSTVKDKSLLPITHKITLPIHKMSKALRSSRLVLRRVSSQTDVVFNCIDETTLSAFAANQQALNSALSLLNEEFKSDVNLESIFTFGSVIKATIVEILNDCVLVSIHTSFPLVKIPNTQLDVRDIKHASALNLFEGQEILVKYFGKNEFGNIQLSRKVLQLTSTA